MSSRKLQARIKHKYGFFMFLSVLLFMKDSSWAYQYCTSAEQCVYSGCKSYNNALGGCNCVAHWNGGSWVKFDIRGTYYYGEYGATNVGSCNECYYYSNIGQYIWWSCPPNCPTSCPSNQYVSNCACIACNSVCSVAGTYEQTACTSTTNRVCSSCTNLVANSNYTGVGTSIDNCPWVCNAGYYKTGGICAACPADNWCSGDILNSCPLNAASPTYSSIQHQCLCKPGFYGDGSKNGTSPCPICPSGSYCPGGNENLTITCPVNFTSNIGADELADCFCKPGYQLTGDVCQLCPPGRFCVSGALNMCPSNSFSPTGSSDISHCQCDAGFFGPNGGTCAQCPANSFCTGGNTITNCTDSAVSPLQSTNSSACYCDRGFQGINNQPCIPCPAGTWCWTGILNLCPTNSSSPPKSNYWLNCTCMPGFTGPDGQACAPCAPGMYKDTNGSDTCKLCPFNTSCPQGSILPTPCPGDSYCNGIQADPCPENTTSPVYSSSISQCIAKGGYYGQPGTLATICPMRTFCPLGSVSPQVCPENSYCQLGSSIPALCPSNTSSPRESQDLNNCTANAGYYGNPGTASSPCTANNYCPKGSIVPLSCPMNTLSPSRSVKFLDCRCKPGFFCSYTKTMKGSRRIGMLPTSWSPSTQQSVIEAMALAASVQSSQINITKIITVNAS